MEVEHEEGRDETQKNLRSSLALLWSESLKRSSMKIQRAKLPNYWQLEQILSVHQKH